ncbi:MAG: metallophosphoesterase family protein [Pseudomonadota bacterium]
MRQFLGQFLGKEKKRAQTGDKIANVLQPDAPFYAIGDIHGRLDLLDVLMQQIDPEANQKLVFLGDYIDRGPDAAGVLKWLFDLEYRRPDQVVCLMGNHERMMLDFIDDPLGRGNIWLRHGGLATLESFGVHRATIHDDPMHLCQALERALDPAMTAWLRQLPLSWHSGNVWCVHAAMDPIKTPTAQRSKTMLWGHPAFLRTSRQDNACVVHGHTTVGAPEIHNSRIAIDTGAYHTGRLTAAYLADNQCRFVQIP